MSEQYANDFVTTLAAPVAAGDLSLTLTLAPPAPLTSGAWRLRIDDEILLVTAVAGAVCTVQRAVEAVAGVQAAASHAAGAVAENVLTSASLLAIAGAQGATGATGPTGGTGAQGAAGTAGPIVWLDPDAGEEGMTIPGPTGAQGAAGAGGATGATGPTGATGTQGATGAQGQAGSQGTAGATGTQGSQGTAGSTVWLEPEPGDGGMVIPGPTGTQGAAGATGAQGTAGATGSQGSQGAQGTAGTTGTTGTQGAQGVGGTPAPWMEPDQGEDGMPIPGPRGATGAQGLQGIPGPIVVFEGDQGEDGMAIPGLKGLQGPQGLQGAAGPPVFWEPESPEDAPLHPFTAMPFGAAGATHAAGLVPDPGTAADTFLKSLLENGWGWKAGEILGYLSVPTTQTTSSLTSVALATPDSVTITLDATTNVLVVYKATEALTAGGPNTTLDQLFLDTVSQAGASSNTGMSAIGFAECAFVIFKCSALAAGSHTFEVKHAVDGGTGSWATRSLILFRAP